MEHSRKDLIGGGALILVGASVTAHSILALNMGTVMRMGPGFFPSALGIILMLLGVLLILPALKASDALPKVAWRSVLCILGSLVAFYLAARFGVIPAVAALVIVASLADDKLSIVGTIVFTVILCLAAYTMITVLGLPLRLIIW